MACNVIQSPHPATSSYRILLQFHMENYLQISSISVWSIPSQAWDKWKILENASNIPKFTPCNSCSFTVAGCSVPRNPSRTSGKAPLPPFLPQWPPSTFWLVLHFPSCNVSTMNSSSVCPTDKTDEGPFGMTVGMGRGRGHNPKQWERSGSRTLWIGQVNSKRRIFQQNTAITYSHQSVISCELLHVLIITLTCSTVEKN